jgi:Zn-dependent M28 family amino/carboxypeptidase
MRRPVLRFLFPALAVNLLLHPCVRATPDNVRFSPVSRERVEARLGKYGGDNGQREATLKKMFGEAGCDDQHLSEQPARGSKVPNVICSLPGTSDKVIIIGAHFDRVSEGDGVVDNWSSASLLPSLYEALKGEARTHTYLFIGFTDEERGLVGSRDYVKQMSQPQVTATEAMINLDTLGLGTTKVWLSHSDKRLANILLYTANQLHLPVDGVNVERIGASSDSEEFAKRKIPRITIHSFTQEAFASRIIHSSKDQLSAMHLDDYYQTYRLVAAYAAVLDNALTPSVSPGTK